jgi:hypothetical protein
MSYEYEIDKIITVFDAQNMEESELQRFREYLRDILDDFEDAAYYRGMDSVHACCDDGCGYY